MGKIEVQVSDRVEKSKTIEAIVKLYDTFDDLLALDYNNLQIYDLHEHIFNTNILGIAAGHQADLGIGEVRYIVTGTELGETKLVFNSGFGEKEISSSAASIQVILFIFNPETRTNNNSMKREIPCKGSVVPPLEYQRQMLLQLRR